MPELEATFDERRHAAVPSKEVRENLDVRPGFDFIYVNKDDSIRATSIRERQRLVY